MTEAAQDFFLCLSTTMSAFSLGYVIYHVTEKISTHRQRKEFEKLFHPDRISKILEKATEEFHKAKIQAEIDSITENPPLPPTP